MQELQDPLEVAVQRASDAAAIAPGARPERDASLVRVRRGVYASAEALREADRRVMYLARIRAVDADRARPIFARESALAIHGIPFGLEPESVFTTGGTSTAGKKAGVVHAQVELDPRDVASVGGLLVCSPAHALADVARRREALVAVAAIDWALRAGLVTKEELLDALGRLSRRRRSAALWAIAFADGASESVGESYSRVRIAQLGFPVPELQVWVAGRSGQQHRVDMRWTFTGRRPLYGEFDGLQKYGELAHQSGKTGARALAEEKVREDELRYSGDLARWIWDDVMQPARLDRILTAHGLHRVRRPAPGLLRLA